MRKLIPILVILLLALTSVVWAQDAAPLKAGMPVLVTSCGQSPGPMKFKVLMKQLKLDYDYELQATADMLVKANEAGKPYQTLIIVTGASLKGMGAAGVSIKDELSRTEALIAEAKKQGITLIGAHVEGMARRSQGAAAGDNSDEQSIDAVCPQAAFLMVRQDGDEDGRFTALSKETQVPVLFFEKNMDLKGVLSKVFQ